MKEGNILELINTERFYYLVKTFKNNFYHFRRSTRSIDEIYSDPKLLFCCLYGDHDNMVFSEFKSNPYIISIVLKTEIEERIKYR